MELDGVKRVAYWITFFGMVLMFGIFRTSERLTFLFRVILIVLLAFLSSNFRLKDKYSFLSFVLVLVACFFTGAVLANDSLQFWAFSAIYLIVFFLGCEVFERKLLGV